MLGLRHSMLTPHVSLSAPQAAATYRYLDRSDVEAWTAKFYDGADADSTTSDTVCLLLLVMAVGCVPQLRKASRDILTAPPLRSGVYGCRRGRAGEGSARQLQRRKREPAPVREVGDAVLTCSLSCSIKLYWAAKRRLDKLPMFPPRLSTVQSYLLMVRDQLCNVSAPSLKLRLLAGPATARPHPLPIGMAHLRSSCSARAIARPSPRQRQLARQTA